MVENENNQIQMDFLEVCSFGDLKKAKAMLKNGKISISFKHHANGWTALHWAARRNHGEIVELLLRAGFDPKSPAKDGKTPLDLVTNEVVKEILKQPVIKADTHAAVVSRASNSNGELDSLLRFLLVRTSIEDGKECFKHVALSGCDSIDVLKLMIERAIKKGEVLEVITLPDKVKITTEEQLRNLANYQKVEVVFSSAVMNKETNCAQKLGANEDTTTHSKHAPNFSSVISEYSYEPASCGISIDDIISVTSADDSIVVDESFSKMKSADLIHKEKMMDAKISEIGVTSDCLLTADSSSSITDISVPSKTLAEDMNKQQEEWDGIIIKDASHKRTLQIALLIGCVVGFGGLTYIICKK